MNSSLEKTLNFTQIQNKLKRHTFLAKQSIPGHPDALLFRLLSECKKIPDKSHYPNFYHWFILMKQFSTHLIDKWIHNVTDSKYPLMQQLLQIYQSNFYKTNDSTTTINCSSHQQITDKCKQYIMELKIEPKQISTVYDKLSSKFRKQLSYIQNISDSEVKVAFLTDMQQFEKIKQETLKWNQIIQTQIRRVRRQNSIQIDQSL